MGTLEEKAYTKRWNQRYQETEFAYGVIPNLFFKEWLLKLNTGSILLPADGEGRNGIFAASMGWETTSTDLSEEGKSKALKLSKETTVSLNYLVGDLERMDFPNESFDVIALIYAHFLPEKKSMLHKKLDSFLKPGGIVILEAFGKKHLAFRKKNPKVGGPNSIEMLYSVEELSNDFNGYEPLVLEETIVSLNEGAYHKGRGSVVRFVGRKV